MSTPYVRRPVLEGNTDIPVQVQPYLQGTVRKTSTGAIPGFATLIATYAADLIVESDLGGPITIPFDYTHTDLLTDIISTINTALSGVATASERDGCLRLQTEGVGETVLGIKSFIRVYPAINNNLGTGIPNDCAPVLGFACYPDPAATVTAGDIESAATRPVEQGNLPGTRLIARGEDRTSSAFNRGLAQLALNADITRTAAVREAYYPVNVELDFNDAYAEGWLRFDVDGNTTQIKLSALPDLFPFLAGRLYVGDLSNTATLREIAKYWGVSDAEGRALAVYDEHYATTRTLRIGAVTRGEQGFGRMYFQDPVSGAPDEDFAPVSSIVNTEFVVADGRNVLGVSRLKQPTTAITEIRGKTNVVCGSLATPATAPTSTTSPTAGVGFKSHGVAKGDVAVIASAMVTSPFCHNGTYYVEDVVSEQELILRPISDTDVESLNPGESAAFGEITIYSSTEWSDDVWVTLDPPLPRFPDNKLVLTFGIERETLNQREDVAESYTDTSAVSDNSELTAFQGLQFWQRQSLGGAYAGMSADRTADAGSIIKERTRSVTLVAPAKSTPSAGTPVRSGKHGTLLGNGVLAAADPVPTPPTYEDTFTLEDVGRVVKLTGGVLLALEPFLITEFIDGAHVRLAPLGASPGSELPSYGSVDYEVYEDVVDYPSPLLTLVAPDEDREGNELSDVGVLYIREQNNTDFLTTRQHGRSLLHLERVSVGYSTPGTAEDIRTVVITGTTATTVTISADVELFQNIFAVEGGTNRPVEPPYNGGSIFRIMNGPNAGFYLIQKTDSTTGNVLTLRTLDGDAITLNTGVPTTQIGAFYNAHVSVGHKLAGTGYGDVAYRTAKLRVFFDSLEQGEEAGVGLSIDWRGQGAGISAQLNDADFVAYDSEAGATGYLIDAQIYSPAHGINLSVTGADSGETERRSARGANIAVEGYQLEATPANWGRLLGGETLSSWGAHIHQEGSDPALVITKGLDVGIYFAHPTDAAVQVRLAPISDLSETRVYRATGGALDVTGSIYLRHPSAFTPGGALYSETGVSAFQYLSSMVPPYFDNDRDGIHAFDDLKGATELGSSDQVYPTLSDTAAPTADLLPPDYAKFPFHHHGVVQVLNDAGFSDFLSPWGLGAERHVGKVVEVLDSYAYGTVTVLGSVTGGVKLTIAGVILEAVVTPGPDQFQEGVDAPTTAVSLAAAINDPSGSLYGTATAVADGEIVTVTAVAVGSAGNTITLVTDTPTELSLSGALVYPSANGTFTVHALHVVQSGNDAYVAVTALNSTTPWAVAQTGTFRMYGRRWHRAYLNIADFALLGTWDSSASRTDLPALTSVDQLVNDRQTQAIDDSQFPVLGLQSYVPWSPATDGASIGFAGEMTSPEMAEVAVSSVDYESASAWYGDALRSAPALFYEFFYEHPWAQAASEPRLPFPNRAIFTMGTDEGEYYSLESGGATNSLAADDYTATFPTGSGMSVYWSANWGGTLAVEFTSGTTATAKVWQKGRTYVLSAHLALRVRLRIAGDLVTASPYITTLSVSLCRSDGTVVWSPSGAVPTTSLAAVPEDREYVITLDDLYKGAPDALNASLQAEQLHLVLTVSTTDTGTAYVLEFTAEQETRPAVVSGPQVVAGAQLAHTYRFTDPVRGFQTLGPASADVVTGPLFGFSGGQRIYGGGDGDVTIDHIGDQEDSGIPGRLRDGDLGTWYQVTTDRNLLFEKGPNSAAVTFLNGAYDPAFYVWATMDLTAVDDSESINAGRFQFPGRTGFILPLDPPHGSALTSLALNMSFRPYYREGVARSWGVYRLPRFTNDSVLGGVSSSQGFLSWEECEAAAGVYVELWRHNAGDFGVPQAQLAEFTEALPPYGYAERLVMFSIDLSEAAMPSAFVNQADPAAFTEHVTHVPYAGGEYFFQKVWDLLTQVPEGGQQVLRVDRRQYSYCLLIRCYGGPREQTLLNDNLLAGYASLPLFTEEQTALSTLTINSFQGMKGVAMGDAFPGSVGGPGDPAGVDVPPRAKFRGARLGWITDRAGDGGW